MPDSKAMFHAVDDLVKSWTTTGDYVHHVRTVKESDDACEFLVIFSRPEPTKPVVEHTAEATFHVKPSYDEESPPKITYTVDTQQQKIPGHLPIRKQWLDAAIRRKQTVMGVSHMFATTSKLPQPQPFVPGMYKAADALADTAMDGLADNEDRLMSAAAAMEEAADVAARNELESVFELEALLVQIFKDADKDGNGYLDPAEFAALLDTAELGLGDMEKKQLLMIADANGDGKMEYAEFAPLGADVIQTMRMRKLNQEENEFIESSAEMQARAVLHGLGEEEVTQLLTNAFMTYDTDKSGRLERREILECLQSLTLGSTKLTPKEIKMIMQFIDEDGSGTIEYNEFAPLMFNWMVEALKMGFLQSEMGDVEMYLHDHISGYVEGDAGKVSFAKLKTALMEMDLVQLTPIQLHTVLADAAADESGAVEVDAFCRGAARLVQRMVDPSLEHKRMTVSKMATITPLQALSEDERERLHQMAARVFQTFDEDHSGKLDRFEFHKCLSESKMGLTDRQISHMMAAADVSEDGLIDYGEFASLFDSVILELARADAIDRMLTQQAEDETRGVIVYDMQRMIDELMIPLHIAFDIASDGGAAEEGDDATVESEALKQMLATKAAEWGLHQETVAAMFEAIDRFEKLTWRQLVEIIEQQHAGTVIE